MIVSVRALANHLEDSMVEAFGITPVAKTIGKALGQRVGQVGLAQQQRPALEIRRNFFGNVAFKLELKL